MNGKTPLLYYTSYNLIPHNWRLRLSETSSFHYLRSWRWRRWWWWCWWCRWSVSVQMIATSFCFLIADFVSTLLLLPFLRVHWSRTDYVDDDDGDGDWRLKILQKLSAKTKITRKDKCTILVIVPFAKDIIAPTVLDGWMHWPTENKAPNQQLISSHTTKRWSDKTRVNYKNT